MNFEGAVISGYGETEYHKKSDRGVSHYIYDSIKRALDSAGLKREDVDGLALASFQLPPDNVTTIAEDMGFNLKWAFSGEYGGASSVIGLLDGVRAIQSGDAEVVVCVAADSFTVESHMATDNDFNTATENYLSPYGYGGANGMFALAQRRHMYEYGTTREQLGKLAVTQRKHASLNPNALLREPLSLEDYLNARVIADPIRLYDCVMPCSGGGAIVITSEEIAKKTKVKNPIKILSGGQRHNYYHDEIINLNYGWRDFQKELFLKANIEHKDLDLIQLYDDYPIMELIQLEDLGFCEKGEGGKFIEENDFSIDGNLPLNTGGGQLSCGQTGAGGGILGLIEAVRQLKKEGGERQVKDPRFALVSGFGMTTYAHGLSASAVILSNE